MVADIVVGGEAIEHAATSEAWLRHTLEEILVQVRVLLDVGGCAFQTVDWEERRIRVDASWFESRADREAFAPVLERPYEPERGGVTEAAIERGEPLLVADFERFPGAEGLRARLYEQLDPEAAAQTWERYRASSFISCPVRTAGGRTLGVLTLSASPPRPALTAEQLRVTEVFASLAALALERSELLEREARRARTEEVLLAAAQAVSSSLDVERVYDAIVEQAAAITGAPILMLSRLDAATQTLRPVASRGATERLLAHRYAAGEGMIGSAVATGKPYLSRSEDRDRFLPWVREEGIASFLHMPITLGPRIFGALSVCSPEPDAFDEADVAVVGAFARAAAGAIANALDFRHQQRVARALTRGFVPGAPPELEGYALGLVYEPVGHEVSGGDFFGVWRLPSGSVALLVGDVSGKGLEVAATSAMVRFFVEARTWDTERPGEVLAQTNAILRRRLPRGVALVTAFLAVVGEDDLRYANAGHVPPLLVGRDGAIAELGNTGLPLGIQDDTEYAEGEAGFAEGELLFAATDGLTEARRDGELFGGAALEALVAEHGPRMEPQALAEHAHAEAQRWARELTDDVAILALRRR
jgi:serine phosphatase RsbU (regulator of sigma subunit)